MNDKILSTLGLCKKAGALSLGFDACIQAVTQKNSYLILVTSDLSKRTLKTLYSQIDNKVDLILLDLSMDDICTILGKSSGIISINSKGFAEKFKQLLNI